MQETTKNRIVRVFGSLGLGIILTVIFPGDFAKISTPNFLISILYDSIIAFILWETNYQIYMVFHNRLAWDAIVKRIIYQSSASLVFTLLMVFMVIPFSNHLLFEKEYQSWQQLLPTLVAIILITVMITSLNAGKEFLENWKASVKQQETLKRKYAEAQYKALRSQVNPHFLFNNFNTLNALILESPEKARTYVDEFSEFYRKVLQQSNSELTTLKEELLLVDHFTFLIRSRYEHLLNLEIDVSTKDNTELIPHMSLQLCLENALKHNKISSRHPLSVLIKKKENRIVVSNKIAIKKVLPRESSGLGLKQIAAVYSSNQTEGFHFGEKNGSFEVELPLIQQND